MIFPIQNVEAAAASTSSNVTEKPVTLLPAAFTRDFMTGEPTLSSFKRESTPTQSNSVKGKKQQEEAEPPAAIAPAARNSSKPSGSGAADGERTVHYKVRKEE